MGKTRMVVSTEPPEAGPTAIYQATQVPYRPNWPRLLWMRLWEFAGLPLIVVVWLLLSLYVMYEEGGPGRGSSALLGLGMAVLGITVLVVGLRTLNSLTLILYRFERLDDATFRLQYAEHGILQELILKKDEAKVSTELILDLPGHRLDSDGSLFRVAVWPYHDLRFYFTDRFTEDDARLIVHCWQGGTLQTWLELQEDTPLGFELKPEFGWGKAKGPRSRSGKRLGGKN